MSTVAKKKQGTKAAAGISVRRRKPQKKESLSFEKVWRMFQETKEQFRETDRRLEERFRETDKKMKEL